jgi:hypothetical protein
VRLGLADAAGPPGAASEGAYGEKVRIAAYGIAPPFLSRFGLALAEDALMLAEERALGAVRDVTCCSRSSRFS